MSATGNPIALAIAGGIQDGVFERAAEALEPHDSGCLRPPTAPVADSSQQPYQGIWSVWPVNTMESVSGRVSSAPRFSGASASVLPFAERRGRDRRTWLGGSGVPVRKCAAIRSI